MIIWESKEIVCVAFQGNRKVLQIGYLLLLYWLVQICWTLILNITCPGAAGICSVVTMVVQFMPLKKSRSKCNFPNEHEILQPNITLQEHGANSTVSSLIKHTGRWSQWGKPKPSEMRGSTLLSYLDIVYSAAASRPLQTEGRVKQVHWHSSRTTTFNQQAPWSQQTLFHPGSVKK